MDAQKQLETPLNDEELLILLKIINIFFVNIIMF